MSNTATLLCIDADDSRLQGLREILEHDGFRVLGAASIEAAERVLNDEPASLCLINHRVLEQNKDAPARMKVIRPKLRVFAYGADPEYSPPAGVDGLFSLPEAAIHLLAKLRENL